MTIHHRSNDSTKTDEKGVIHIHVKLGHMYIELSCDVEVLILTPLWIKIQQKTEPTTLNSCGFIYILIILSRSCKYVSLYLIMWKFFSLLSIFKHTHVLPTIIFVKNLFPHSNSLKKNYIFANLNLPHYDSHCVFDVYKSKERCVCIVRSSILMVNYLIEFY